MEFLLIGESKIKIVLNKEESAEFNLGTSDIGGAEARRSFWRLINMAKEHSGFDPAGDKLLIQLYPMKEGLEIFVTKLGILPDSSARLVSRSNKISLLSREKSLYAFDSLEDLILAARAVKVVSNGVSLESDVYLLSGKYFLSIEEYGKGGETVEFPCILEFATPLTAELSAYITEHSTCLTCGEGIERFASL